MTERLEDGWSQSIAGAAVEMAEVAAHATEVDLSVLKRIDTLLALLLDNIDERRY